MRRKSIYIVKVLTAICWVDMERKACSPAYIANCFHHCLKRGKSLTNAEKGVDNDATHNITEKDVRYYEVTVSSSGLERLLHVFDEDGVMEAPTIDHIGRESAEVDEVADADANDDVHVVESEFSEGEDLKCLAQALGLLERSRILCDAN